MNSEKYLFGDAPFITGAQYGESIDEQQFLYVCLREFFKSKQNVITFSKEKLEKLIGTVFSESYIRYFCWELSSYVVQLSNTSGSFSLVTKVEGTDKQFTVTFALEAYNLIENFGNNYLNVPIRFMMSSTRTPESIPLFLLCKTNFSNPPLGQLLKFKINIAKLQFLLGDVYNGSSIWNKLVMSNAQDEEFEKYVKKQKSKKYETFEMFKTD